MIYLFRRKYAGVIEDGVAFMVIGTFGACFVVSDKPIRDPYKKLVVKGNHGVGNWTIEAFTVTSASRNTSPIPPISRFTRTISNASWKPTKPWTAPYSKTRLQVQPL